MTDAAAETPLRGLIEAIIRKDGPITVERYWDFALFHPEHGYYTTRDPFGRGGDFVTAPEVSQMFGELLAAWLLAAWHGLGRPSPFVLAEIGPGRGTLMADILRTARRLDMGFLKAAQVALVETSPRLAALQADRLAAFDLPIRHVRRVEELPAGPLLLVANELFDAVAIRQWVSTADGWAERCVGLDEEEKLAFVLPTASRERTGHDGAAILETSPQRDAIADAIARRLAGQGGAALLIDYGHLATGFGDTLQAIRDHRFADPLDHPGQADITSHVDFESLARRFASAGLRLPATMEQGEFLLRLGLSQRMSQLADGKPVAEQGAILASGRRLAGLGEGKMGRLFKVLAVSSQPLDLPPFGTAPHD